MSDKIYTLLKRWIMAFFGEKPIIGIIYLPKYIVQFYKYRKLSIKSEKISVIDSYPCLTDCISSTPFDAHYFYQGAWLARKLTEIKPEKHVDIGSSVLAISTVSAQIPTIFVDYRPLNAKLSNLLTVAGDIMSLPFATNSIASISCMHVIEHIGLGRYGDPIDPAGTYKALTELERIVAPRGRLYLTTPVGRERTCFNAHKVFSPADIVNLMPNLTLRSFAWVDDAGRYYESGEPNQASGNEYACGFYVFEK